MHIKVAHFLSLSELFAKCTLFKWHKHIVESSIWQKYLWIKIVNLNKNIYWEVKFNKHTPIICINIQMHFCYDFISIFFIGIQYMIHDDKKNGLKKKIKKCLTNKKLWTFEWPNLDIIS